MSLPSAQEALRTRHTYSCAVPSKTELIDPYDRLSRVTAGRMALPREAPCGAVLLLQSGIETGTVIRESCGTV